MLSTLLFSESLIEDKLSIRVESSLIYLMRDDKLSFWLLTLEMIFCSDALSPLIYLIRSSIFFSVTQRIIKKKLAWRTAGQLELLRPHSEV